MKKVPVIWKTFDDTPAYARWDQDFLRHVLLPPSLYQHHDIGKNEGFNADGAVVVFPAGHNEKFIPELNAFLRPKSWVVLCLTSDEESTFPVHRITHPNIRIWLSTPRPDRHDPKFGYRFLPLGYPIHETDSFSLIPPAHEDVYDWFFHGQVAHQRRDDMIAGMSAMPNGKAIPSPGFTQGMPRREYLHSMALSKVCPSPSGPTSPDSFRTWEALEAGAVPIVDEGPKPDEAGRAVGGYPAGFWELLLGDVPFPVLSDWKYGPAATRAILETYPTVNNVIFAWWQLHKRELRRRLAQDVEELSGRVVQGDRVNDIVTCVVPTSPTPNNPDSSHLDITLAAIRAQLPTAEILLMIDGVHDRQSHLKDAYNEYVRRILWKCNHYWLNVTPILFDDYLHQSGKLIRTLPYVTTPLILWNEHDTPLEGDIAWDLCAAELMEDRLDLVRFYHEAHIHPEHAHLMRGRHGDLFEKTVQQSGRPHLARTDYYRRVMAEHFSADTCTFIEFVMHGVCQCEDIEPWEKHRMALYAPDGGQVIKRSGHTDARGGEPTYEETLRQ